MCMQTRSSKRALYVSSPQTNIKERGRAKVYCANFSAVAVDYIPESKHLPSSGIHAQRLARKLFREPLTSHAEKHLSTRAVHIDVRHAIWKNEPLTCASL